ncbi:hypothetical protein [Shewanella algae]|uniref:hypothetical protein n=1 Tax=Shewanella algae TaxID=38313 RepID=UPI00313EFE7F
MTQEKIYINETLIALLKSRALMQFTVIELQTMYMERVSEITGTQVTQLIHRNLNKLCRANLLEKRKKGRIVQFAKTALFDDTRLTARPVAQYIKKSKKNSEACKLQRLKTKLDEYQADLHGYVAQTEEFQRLFCELPEAKNSLYSHYIYARNQSSSMVGKIKALEACICILGG